MKTKVVSKVLIVFILGYLSQAVVAELSINSRSGIELFEWFEVEGAWQSVEISHQQANDIVEYALASNDPKLIGHAVMGMAMNAALISGRWEKHTNNTGLEVYPYRTFHQVSGLKKFLMDYYREGLKADGWNWSPELTVVNGEGWFKGKAWATAPSILANNFSNDPEVYDFIFDTHEETMPRWTLYLLSDGKYRTPRANQFRIECLEIEGNRFLNQIAAEALGEFQTSSGLYALEKRLHEDHGAVAEIAKAIMAHGDAVDLHKASEFVAMNQGNPHPSVKEAVNTINQGIQQP